MNDHHDDAEARWPIHALDAAIEGARLAAPKIEGPDARHYAFVPRGFTLQEMPHRGQLDPYAKGSITVDDAASFHAYVNLYKAQSRAILLADVDAGKITALLDYHPQNDLLERGQPGPNAHRCTLVLRPSEEFKRWDAMAGKLHEQTDFARFLEENSVDVEHPEAAAMIELAKDFEATSGQTFKSSARLDNGDRTLRFEQDTKVVSDVVIPALFTLALPLYAGEPASTCMARFRWKATAGGVLLGFEWHRVQYQRLAVFQEIATAAAEATGLPMVMGRT